MPGRPEETKPYPPTQKEADLQAAAQLNQQEAEAREPEERQVEEEHRKALEEEAMEQVGQAEHLEEEHDPSPEEQDREWKEQDREWKEQREQGEAAHLLEGRARAEEVQGHPLQVTSDWVLLAGIGSVPLFLHIKEKGFPIYDSL